MQFTKQFIGLFSVVVFATTFLPRHWWHECNHDHHIRHNQSDSRGSGPVLSAPECAICAFVMPYFIQGEIVDVECLKAEFEADYFVSALVRLENNSKRSCPGRAPPAVFDLFG